MNPAREKKSNSFGNENICSFVFCLVFALLTFDKVK